LGNDLAPAEQVERAQLLLGEAAPERLPDPFEAGSQAARPRSDCQESEPWRG